MSVEKNKHLQELLVEPVAIGDTLFSNILIAQPREYFGMSNVPLQVHLSLSKESYNTKVQSNNPNVQMSLNPFMKGLGTVSQVSGILDVEAGVQDNCVVNIKLKGSFVLLFQYLGDIYELTLEQGLHELRIEGKNPPEILIDGGRIELYDNKSSKI